MSSNTTQVYSAVITHVEPEYAADLAANIEEWLRQRRTRAAQAVSSMTATVTATVTAAPAPAPKVPGEELHQLYTPQQFVQYILERRSQSTFASAEALLDKLADTPGTWMTFREVAGDDANLLARLQRMPGNLSPQLGTLEWPWRTYFSRSRAAGDASGGNKKFLLDAEAADNWRQAKALLGLR